MLPTPVELREQSLRYREAARRAESLAAKRWAANCALALAQIAEQIERDGEIVEAVRGAAERYKQMLARVLGDKTGQLVEALLSECRADSDTRRRIKSWGMRAEELRATADLLKVQETQATLGRAADNDERLADNAEARLAHDPIGKTGQK
jgi:hypothetical protein